ncbi:hypothetical protein ACIBAC_29055 [Streptomyces sp. NPDC051362]|uniref:hypothetical protein n=1 Tax=Streptomyces sp. NPDC051362 TaxID=3365651 RepID=UPI00379E9B03
MTHSPELATEPCRSRGGAGSAARGQWVRYPLRVILDAEAYADTDTRVYGKVAALARGRDCEASVIKIASYVGIGVSTAEKSLSRLSRPAPTDGVRELGRQQRAHDATGTGRTNARWTRELDKGERYVWAPVLAADTLRGTMHRLYLFLRYTEVVERRQLSLSEMAWVLRHHSGRSKGQPLAEAVVAKLLEGLQELGWITLDKRAGYRGRHLITVHDDPVHLVQEPEPSPDPDGGVAPDLDGGANAYKEDLELNDPRNTLGGGTFRRRRDDRKWVELPVDNRSSVPSGPASVASVAATFQPAVRPSGRPAYAGPPLTLSRDAWELLAPVLAPVGDLMADVSPYMTRRIAREILRQIRDDGIWPEEIRDQVARLRRWTPAEEITDPGRWLLGAVLPVRSRCQMTGCHWGFLAHTGMPCKACAEIDDARKRERQRTAHPPHLRHHCTECHRPAYDALPTGLCHTCRPTA